jgi:hypothetical protein
VSCRSRGLSLRPAALSVGELPNRPEVRFDFLAAARLLSHSARLLGISLPPGYVNLVGESFSFFQRHESAESIGQFFVADRIAAIGSARRMALNVALFMKPLHRS